MAAKKAAISQKMLMLYIETRIVALVVIYMVCIRNYGILHHQDLHDDYHSG